jgi:hypothetical protein
MSGLAGAALQPVLDGDREDVADARRTVVSRVHDRLLPSVFTLRRACGESVWVL